MTSTEHSQAPFTASLDDRPVERDPDSGSVTWRTLISSDRTPSGELIFGVAEFPPHGDLLPHWHEPAELYFGLGGSGTVTIDGASFAIAKGVAVFIPGKCVHGVVAGADGLSFAYGFARDDYGSIVYHMVDATAAAS